MKNILWALPLCAVVSGCAGRYPALPVEANPVLPAEWRTSLGPGAPIERDWWQAFGDLVLTRLVETAIANNADIGVAAARVQEARAQERLARSQLSPTLGLGVETTYSNIDLPFDPPLDRTLESTRVQPVFQASYEVDLFGRIRQQAQAGRQSFLASQAASDAARLSVAAATATTYITLRGIDARLDILNETLRTREEALRFARRRSETGYTSQLEFRQAEAEYEATRQAVPQLELAKARAENALSVLMGEAPREVERGSELMTLQTPRVPDGLPSDLLRRRPDIAQAEHTLAASDASLAAARAQFLPQVRLTGTAGEILASSFNAPLSLFSIGGSILAPILDGGRIRANAEAATARRSQAAFGYERTVLIAFREVEDALASVARLDDQKQRLLAQRAAVAATVGHAERRFRAGYTPAIELIEARRALLSVDLSIAQVRSDELAAHVALYQAMGGGWRAEPDAG
jgi:outer membrane protein, multidrug efflux system